MTDDPNALPQGWTLHRNWHGCRVAAVFTDPETECVFAHVGIRHDGCVECAGSVPSTVLPALLHAFASTEPEPDVVGATVDVDHAERALLEHASTPGFGAAAGNGALAIRWLRIQNERLESARGRAVKHGTEMETRYYRELARAVHPNVLAFAKKLAAVRGKWGRGTIRSACIRHWPELGEDIDSIDGRLPTEIDPVTRKFLNKLARSEVRADLAIRHLTAICAKAEAGPNCLLCGEAFDTADGAPRSFPECPVPSARDWLADPEGTISAVLRASGEEPA